MTNTALRPRVQAMGDGTYQPLVVNMTGDGAVTFLTPLRTAAEARDAAMKACEAAMLSGRWERRQRGA